MNEVYVKMFNIELSNNKGFNWYHNENIHVIGFAFLDNEMIDSFELANYIKSCTDRKTFKESISRLNGFFSIVVEVNQEVWIATDIVRSFPVFHTQIGNNNIITDDIKEIQFKTIDQNSYNEFMALGYTTSDNTLYENVKQVECSTCLFIASNGRIDKTKYYEFQYDISYEEDESRILNDIEKTYDNVAQKMISFLNGRTALIPLSGGHDSRLIAYLLKKNKYEKVITYTYGRDENEEALVSRKVAEYLGYDWHFIEYDTKTMRRMYNNPDSYYKIADYLGRGFTVPLIQEWVAIDYLIKNNIVDENCVAIPGHTGDFLTGGHLRKEFIETESMEMSKLIDTIIECHYNLYKYEKYNKDLNNTIKERIYKTVGIKPGTIIKSEDAACIFEKFNYKERQSKHICNSVRLYEYYELQWYMPLWDREVVNQWLKIPISLRYNREIYEKYTYEEYRDLMDSIPIANIYDGLSN